MCAKELGREMAGNRLSPRGACKFAWCCAGAHYCATPHKNKRFFACRSAEPVEYIWIYCYYSGGAYKRDFSLLLFITTRAINKNKNSRVEFHSLPVREWDFRTAAVEKFWQVLLLSAGFNLHPAPRLNLTDRLIWCSSATLHAA